MSHMIGTIPTVRNQALVQHRREQEMLAGEPAVNAGTNRDTASKMANLLEGLQFPATKEDVRNYINRKSPAMGNRTNDVFEAVQNNLEDGVKYDSAYAIELAAGLVEKKQ